MLYTIIIIVIICEWEHIYIYNIHIYTAASNLKLYNIIAQSSKITETIFVFVEKNEEKTTLYSVYI